MAEEVSKEMNVGVSTLRDALEEAYTKIYGSDGFTTYKFGGLPAFKAKGVGDRIEIKQDNGNTFLDTSRAEPETAEEVEDILLEYQHASGRDWANEDQSGDVDYGTEDSPVRDRGGVDGGEVEVFDDGSIKFKPRYTKQRAGYKGEKSNDTGMDCHNCAHFIEGGGCHVVQGEISPHGACTNFYADVGVFADAVGQAADVSLVLYGEEFDLRWDYGTLDMFIDAVEDRISDRLD